VPAEGRIEALLGHRRALDRGEGVLHPLGERVVGGGTGRRVGGLLGEVRGEGDRRGRIEGVRRDALGERRWHSPQGEHGDNRGHRNRQQGESVETEIDHWLLVMLPNLQAWREDKRGFCSWTMNRPCRRFSPTRSARKGMTWWARRTGTKP
jgi:hypothetical protein